MKKGNDTEIVQLHKGGKSFRQIGRQLGISHVAARKRYLKASKVNCDVNHTPEKGSIKDKIGHDQPGNPKEENISPSVCAKDTSTILNPRAESTEAAAEPRYYKHIPTGQLFHRNAKIEEEIRSECEPYYPPKYLKKLSEPNKGAIYAWTVVIDQRTDFEPYDGPLPVASKPRGRE